MIFNLHFPSFISLVFRHQVKLIFTFSDNISLKLPFSCDEETALFDLWMVIHPRFYNSCQRNFICQLTLFYWKEIMSNQVNPPENVGNSCLGVFCKKCIIKNFAKLTEKHLWRSLLFKKVAGLHPPTLFKKESPTHVFSYELCEQVKCRNPPTGKVGPLPVGTVPSLGWHGTERTDYFTNQASKPKWLTDRKTVRFFYHFKSFIYVDVVAQFFIIKISSRLFFSSLLYF